MPASWTRASEVCPWVHPVRLGVCALPARGPARFFGGEDAVVELLAERADEDVSVGVADGLFAAVLAARAELIVPPGTSADFLAPWSVATLARPDLAVTLQRLGITTLGQFAALPAANVSDRFGADAAVCHTVARGESGDLTGLRDRAIERRLRVARGEDPDRGDAPPAPAQPSFFGGTSEADRRAARAVVKVQERLGIEAVLVGRLQGGRDPAGQSVLVPWGSPDAASGAAGSGTGPDARPGRDGVPPPAPTEVLQTPPAPSWSTPRGTPWWWAGGDCSLRRSTGSRSTAAPGSRWWRGPGPGRSPSAGGRCAVARRACSW